MRILLAIGLLCFPAIAFAQPLTIDKAWSTPAMKGMSIGVAYLTLTNHSNEARTLTTLTSPVSEQVEIHTHIHEDEVMKMRKLSSLAIAADTTVTFEPGGLHLMLIGLKQPLTLGDQFPLTLTFDDDSQVETSVTVEPRDKAQTPKEPEHHGHH